MPFRLVPEFLDAVYMVLTVGEAFLMVDPDIKTILSGRIMRFMMGIRVSVRASGIILV